MASNDSNAGQEARADQLDFAALYPNVMARFGAVQTDATSDAPREYTHEESEAILARVTEKVIASRMQAKREEAERLRAAARSFEERTPYGKTGVFGPDGQSKGPSGAASVTMAGRMAVADQEDTGKRDKEENDEEGNKKKESRQARRARERAQEKLARKALNAYQAQVK